MDFSEVIVCVLCCVRGRPLQITHSSDSIMNHWCAPIRWPNKNWKHFLPIVRFLSWSGEGMCWMAEMLKRGKGQSVALLSKALLLKAVFFVLSQRMCNNGRSVWICARARTCEYSWWHSENACSRMVPKEVAKRPYVSTVNLSLKAKLYSDQPSAPPCWVSPQSATCPAEKANTLLACQTNHTSCICVARRLG